MKKTSNLWYIALAIGLVFFFFYSAKWNIIISAWIWPSLILLFLRKKNTIYHLLLVVFSMGIVGSIKWYGILTGTFWGEIGVGFVLGIIPSIAFIVDFFLSKRIKSYLSAFVFPLSFAASEFLIQLSPLSILGSMAATQTSNIALIQTASVFGSYGITFLVSWLASTLLYVFDHYQQKETKKAGRGLMIYTFTLVFFLSFGGLRLAFSNPYSPCIKIALTTGPYYGDFTKNELVEPTIERNIDSMENLVSTAALGKADLLVFSEEAFWINDTDEDLMLGKTKEAAKKNNIFVLAAFDFQDTDNSNDGKDENVVFLFNNEGEIVYEYHKTHLVPVIETSTVTSSDNPMPNQVLTLPSGTTIKLASIICMDGDFPSYVRDNLDNDTGLLMIPTYDWPAIHTYHSKWVELRSVENGVSLIRSTMDGISTVSDAYGREVTVSDTYSSGYENVVFSEITYQPVFTLYKYIGSVIDWGYVILLIGLVIIAFVPWKKKEISNQ